MSCENIDRMNYISIDFESSGDLDKFIKIVGADVSQFPESEIGERLFGRKVCCHHSIKKDVWKFGYRACPNRSSYPSIAFHKLTKNGVVFLTKQKLIFFLLYLSHASDKPLTFGPY
jgi:hypothetical protein